MSKLLNCKVICTKEFNSGKGVTVGKVYEIVNGRLTYDNGKKSLNEFISIEELNDRNKAKFKKYK